MLAKSRGRAKVIAEGVIFAVAVGVTVVALRRVWVLKTVSFSEAARS